MLVVARRPREKAKQSRVDDRFAVKDLQGDFQFAGRNIRRRFHPKKNADDASPAERNTHTHSWAEIARCVCRCAIVERPPQWRIDGNFQKHLRIMTSCPQFLWTSLCTSGDKPRQVPEIPTTFLK